MRKRSGISPRYADPLVFTFLTQAFLYVFLVLVLTDTTASRQLFRFAAAGFWGAVALILHRRPHEPTRGDLLFIGLGFLPVHVLAAFVAVAVWNWRGVIR